MINLLPDDYKSDIQAARANVIITRYIAIISLAFLFMFGALYTSYTVLTVTMTNAEDLIEANDVKADAYSDTQQKVTELSAELNQSKAILDQEIRYSNVLMQLGQTMPAGTVLGNLTLAAENFTGTPLDITVYAATPDQAGQVQSQLQRSPLFTQVTLKSTDDTGQGIAGYPVSVQLSVVFRGAGL